jgi:hypothetical protein
MARQTRTRRTPKKKPGPGYERASDPLAPRSAFFARLTNNLKLGLCLVLGSLAVGILGYHFIGGLAWIDAFVDASMILSGMGPVNQMTGTGGKLFAGVYALYSGFALLATAGVVMAPILHRFLHRFHLEDEADEEAK